MRTDPHLLSPHRSLTLPGLREKGRPLPETPTSPKYDGRRFSGLVCRNPVKVRYIGVATLTVTKITSYSDGLSRDTEDFSSFPRRSSTSVPNSVTPPKVTSLVF